MNICARAFQPIPIACTSLYRPKLANAFRRLQDFHFIVISLSFTAFIIFIYTLFINLFTHIYDFLHF